MYKSFFKRIIDISISFFAFVILFPVFFLITIVLAIQSNGKPFFMQKRPGKHEKIFDILKFKTMSDKIDSNGNLLPDEKRITRIGLFLRKTSLDEIPQLLNILKGDMSLIGPRPLRVRYLPYYTKEESIRHTIRPGITGLAQISGRNFLHWDERLKKDIEYVNNISFYNDIKILISTFFKVFSFKDVALDSDSGMLDLDVLRKKHETLL